MGGCCAGVGSGATGGGSCNGGGMFGGSPTSGRFGLGCLGPGISGSILEGSYSGLSSGDEKHSTTQVNKYLFAILNFLPRFKIIIRVTEALASRRVAGSSFSWHAVQTESDCVTSRLTTMLEPC